MKKYIFLIVCLFFYKNNAEQFIYPVADFDNGKQLMLLYQKSLEDVELWIWDSCNQHAKKGLSSFLTPANLRMMPSGKAFSFIDQGYIKIKEFAKRSPKTLPIYEPIGLFSSMNWIDDETFYFVAQEGDFFQIFQGDLQANIKKLTCEAVDALYPQKIDTTLFYMQRNINNQVAIVARQWNPLPIDINKNQSEIFSIIKKSSQQLCFLHMTCDSEGFFLQAPTKIIQNNNGNDCYKFACYHLQKNKKEWVTEKLFTFQIPSKYVTGPARLYESLEPFLPNYTCKDCIYFVDWQHDSNQFELQKYLILNKNLEKIPSQFLQRNINQQIFSPYIRQEKIYCGIIYQDKKSLRNIFEAEDIRINLPFFLKNKTC